MDKRNLAFGKINFILVAVGMAVVILGFFLMSGGGSTEDKYDPEIFSTMRIGVAPVICFIGFVSIIFAILYRPKEKDEAQENQAIGQQSADSVEVRK